MDATHQKKTFKNGKSKDNFSKAPKAGSASSSVYEIDSSEGELN